MTAAAAAVHLRALHPKAVVVGRVDSVGDGSVKTRPTGPALEFGRGSEQSLTATCACKRAGPLFVKQRAAPWALGAVAAQYRVLLRCEQSAPFGIRVGDSVVFRWRCRRTWIAHELTTLYGNCEVLDPGRSQNVAGSGACPICPNEGIQQAGAVGQ